MGLLSSSGPGDQPVSRTCNPCCRQIWEWLFLGPRPAALLNSLVSLPEPESPNEGIWGGSNQRLGMPTLQGLSPRWAELAFPVQLVVWGGLFYHSAPGFPILTLAGPIHTPLQAESYLLDNRSSLWPHEWEKPSMGWRGMKREPLRSRLRVPRNPHLNYWR